MKLMTLPQYMKMSKPALIRKIMKILKAMPKKRLAMVCYNITKAKLPRLKVIKRKALPKRSKKQFKLEKMTDEIYIERLRKESRKKRKTKRKFSRKQLAAQRLFAKRARAGTLRRR